MEIGLTLLRLTVEGATQLRRNLKWRRGYREFEREGGV